MGGGEGEGRGGGGEGEGRGRGGEINRKDPKRIPTSRSITN